MIDEKTKSEILDLIGSSGAVESNIHINGNISHIISMSSGSPRIQTNVVNKFKLVLSQIEELKTLSPFEIRCAVCKRVIQYPAWHYRKEYAVNVFDYFICLDKSSVNKPNTSCRLL